MATSTVPAAKAALLAVLENAAGLAGVQTSIGMPLGDLQPELIVVGKVEGDQRWAALGKRGREETYTVSLYLSVVNAGADQQAADERCFALMLEIENALRADVTLGGLVHTAEVYSFALAERPLGGEREAQLTVGVYVTARI